MKLSNYFIGIVALFLIPLTFYATPAHSQSVALARESPSSLLNITPENTMEERKIRAFVTAKLFSPHLKKRDQHADMSDLSKSAEVLVSLVVHALKIARRIDGIDRGVPGSIDAVLLGVDAIDGDLRGLDLLAKHVAFNVFTRVVQHFSTKLHVMAQNARDGVEHTSQSF